VECSESYLSLKKNMVLLFQETINFIKEITEHRKMNWGDQL